MSANMKPPGLREAMEFADRAAAFVPSFEANRLHAHHLHALAAEVRRLQALHLERTKLTDSAFRERDDAIALAEQQKARGDQYERDAAIGRLVREKLVSGNAIPVWHCTIRADEVAAIDAAPKAEVPR